jgi:UDP-3-O-[3-hydroxymyristoyl] glucosamine N-acyltransferase
MEFSAEKIASFLNGYVEGDKDITVNNISKIEEGVPGTLSFLANPKYTEYIYSTNSSIVLVSKTFNAENKINATLIRVDDPYKAFASLLELYSLSKNQKSGISPKAVIEESAKTGENVYLGANVYIGENTIIKDNVKIYPNTYIGDNVEIDENTTIFSGVNIYSESIIGKNCTIHSGTVIGGDGFGFAPQSKSEFVKIPQIGNVIIEDNVEIGANTCIDRATMGSTIIKKGVKLDNLIQVGHNVIIGENTVIAAQTGVSGSTKIGKNCMIGGQVGFAGHLTICDNVKIGAQAGIIKDITTEGAVLIGSPVQDMRQFFKNTVLISKLPEMRKQINDVENSLNSFLKNK